MIFEKLATILLFQQPTTKANNFKLIISANFTFPYGSPDSICAVLNNRHILFLTSNNSSKIDERYSNSSMHHFERYAEQKLRKNIEQDVLQTIKKLNHNLF